MQSWQFDVLIALAISSLAFLAVVTTANNIGVTYDEPVYAGEALRVQSWMQQVFDRTLHGEMGAILDQSLIREHWLRRDMQPALLKIAIALLSPITGELFSGLAGYRAVTALFFSLMIAATYCFGRLAENRMVGLFAALSLFFLPHVFAHAHLIALDVPVAAMNVLATLTFFIAVTKQRLRWFIAAGVALGLALSAKMNSILVLPSILLWCAFQKYRTPDPSPSPPEGKRVRLRGQFGFIALSALVAFATFFISWPYLWVDSFEHLRKYAEFHFQHYPVHVSYFGKIYNYAPWHFPLVMIGFTTPVITLALMAMGTIGAARESREKRGGSLLWLISAGFQLAAFINPGTPKYNGVRLFLSVFPFLCLLAGMAFDRISLKFIKFLERSKLAKDMPHLPGLAVTTLLLLTVLPGMYDTVDSHPFGMSYYNVLIGGTRGAAKRGFEPTYWGDAFFHVLEFLDEHAPPGATIAVIPGTVDWLFRYYQNLGMLRKDLIISREPQNFDYLVFHTRQSEMTPLAKLLLGMGRRQRMDERDKVFAYAVRYQGTVLAAVVTPESAQKALEVMKKINAVSSKKS